MARTTGSRAQTRNYPATRLAVAMWLTIVTAAACSPAMPTSSTTPSLSSSDFAQVATPATATPSTAISAAPSPTPSRPSAAPSPRRSSAPLAPVAISLTNLGKGYSSPIGLSSTAGDSRLFVIEQTGQIVTGNDGKPGTVFLDIAQRISCCGERGLLGLAFHPDYAANGRFFVRYTTPAGDVRVSEFHVSSDPKRADPASEKVIITIPHPDFGNHNGGRIEFGADGYLYIGTGDGGSGGDPNGHGQALNTLLGKMHRIDVDHPSGNLAYSIPSTNPFASQAGARGEIWAYGLRNPYTFSFDAETHDLWIADVGQDAWEEVDRATAVSDGGGRGANYGWNAMEGNHCYKPASGCSTSGLTPPLAEYAHGSNDSIGCAIIGGYVYRGSAHPELTGRYFFGDYCSGRIWDVDATGAAGQSIQQLLVSGLQITGWGQGADGELYLTAGNGNLYRLD